MRSSYVARMRRRSPAGQLPLFIHKADPTDNWLSSKRYDVPLTNSDRIIHTVQSAGEASGPPSYTCWSLHYVSWADFFRHPLNKQPLSDLLRRFVHLVFPSTGAHRCHLSVERQCRPPRNPWIKSKQKIKAAFSWIQQVLHKCWLN